MSDVTVIGTITAPELRFTQAGKPVLGFSLAENHRKKDQQGQWQDDGTTWRKVSVWDRKAETLAEHLSKGDRVIVTGFERIREFDKQDGCKGQSLELTAREVGIVPKAQPQQYTQGQEHRTQGDPWAGSDAQQPNWNQAEPPF